jgi:hypothetical protein
MFSFGVTATYVMLNDMIFQASDEELGGDDARRHILRRHTSYFGDEDRSKGPFDTLEKRNHSSTDSLLLRVT